MILEVVALGSLVLATIGFSKLLNFKSLWLSFPAGVALAIALRGATFTFLYAFGWQSIASLIWYVSCAAVFGYAVITRRDGLLRLSRLPVAIGALAFLAGRVIGLAFTGHTDSKWILVIARQVAQGGNLDIFNDPNTFKRGFIYPITLALGDPHEFFSSLTAYSFGALMSLGVALVLLLLQGYRRRTIILSATPVVAALITCTLFWRATVYLNSHLFMGITLALIVIVSAMAIKRGSLQNNELAVLAVASYLAGMGRAEGLLVGIIAMLPLLSQKWVSRRQLLIMLVPSAFAFGIWLTDYNSYVLKATHLPWYAFTLIAMIAVSIPAIKWFDWLRVRSVLIFGTVLALYLAALTVAFSSTMVRGFASEFYNLVLTKGSWGYFWVVVVLAIALGFRSKFSVEHQVVVKSTVLLVLVFLASKTLDDIGNGHPNIGRSGWGDSLNRMWLHILVLGAALAISAIAKRLQPNVSTVPEYNI